LGFDNHSQPPMRAESVFQGPPGDGDRRADQENCRAWPQLGRKKFKRTRDEVSRHQLDGASDSPGEARIE